MVVVVVVVVVVVCVCVCVCVCVEGVGGVSTGFFLSGPWVIFPPKCVLSLRKPLYQPPAGILKLPL